MSITGSTLTTETIGSSNALKLAYSITDGGDLDDDNEANGVIVDPVGLATEDVASATDTVTNSNSSNGGELSDTGTVTRYVTILAGVSLVGVGVVALRNRLKNTDSND